MRFVTSIKGAENNRYLLGEKASELALLSSAGINIPQSLVLTTEAYQHFLTENNLRQKLNHLINAGAEKKAKELILDSDIPQDLAYEIFNAYRGLGKLFSDESVTLSPSITDPHDFFRHTSIKVKGEATLIHSIKELWATYFDEEHFSHRQSRYLNHFKNSIAIIIQKSIKQNKSGSIAVDKGGNRIITTSKLSIKENDELLKIGQKIKDLYYFSKKADWVIEKGKIYIVSLGPTHVEAPQEIIAEEIPSQESVSDEVEIIEYGSIGGIATGVAKIVQNKKDIDNIRYGDIVILPAIKDYDQVKALKHAKAVVIESEIDNKHIKTVISHMGFPVVIGKPEGSLRDGMIITVDGTKGQVYQGEFKN